MKSAVPKGVLLPQRFLDQDAHKLRGGYYTSEPIAARLCEWAIRTDKERVLEPSCGDGVFLNAIARRLHELGAHDAAVAAHVSGIEMDSVEADLSRSRLSTLIGARARKVVETVDFFQWWQDNKQRKFDVIVGNPPFIRYQSFPELHRQQAMSIMVELGLKPNKLSNIWAPFVVAATACLSPGGRLGMVIPAELLQVTYAGQVRRYLIDHFARIDIVACNELLFEKVQQEVVLLLADGARPASSQAAPCLVSLTETHTREEITDQTPAMLLASAQPEVAQHDEDKWLKYFLAERELALLREVSTSGVATRLSNYASVDVGVVTGRNEFFILTPSEVAELGLKDYSRPIVSRSAQLAGSRFSKNDWRSLAKDDQRVLLLDLAGVDSANLDRAVSDYVSAGEGKAFHKGYKCAIRDPWYVVPSVWIPDGFAFRQIYDFPRFILNRAAAASTDTIHRLTFKSAKPELVIACTYTWLTGASAEIEGRSYGGGVLELEPNEAERLLVPAVLKAAMPLGECDRLVRAGRLKDVLEENAKTILMGQMRLSRKDCMLLYGIWTKMRDRRLMRREH